MGFLILRPLFLCILVSISSANLPYIPDYKQNIPNLTLFNPGDIYIMHLSWNRDGERENQTCQFLVNPSLTQFNYAADLSLKAINRDPNILPNITLGMVALDTCGTGIITMGQGQKFTPWKGDTDMASMTISSKRFNIVGIMGPYRSPTCVSTITFFNYHQIPMISPGASSDEMSDRNRYGNFFRVVAPDSFQTISMVAILEMFNWTYISAVYEESAYGFNGIIQLKRRTQEKGFCIADSLSLSYLAKDEDFDNVVRKLIKNRKAKAVVIFTIFRVTVGLLKALERFDALDMFIFIFSDGTGESIIYEFPKLSRGSFLVDFYNGGTIDEFKAYVEDLTPAKSPENPWLRKIWKDAFDCTLEQTMDPGSICSTKKMTDVPNYGFFGSAMTGLQVPTIFAKAIDSLIRAQCPQAFKDKSLLTKCVKPSYLIEYLKNTTLETEEGPIRFNEFGAMTQGYRIKQVHGDINNNPFIKLLGKWTPRGLSLSVEDMVWYRRYANGEAGLEVPESVCAKPCQPGEFLLQGELHCCWECIRCRDNEYVTNNGTSCTACQVLTWPDQETFDYCIKIEPSFLFWTDKYGIGLTAMAGGGLITTLVIAFIMMKNRDKKVIKGSSVNMMAVVLLGLILIFITVLLFIAKPTFLLCLISRIGFSMSCTLVFTPLLIKTNRVYQVFKASSKLTKVGRSAKASVSAVLVAFTLAIQVAIIGVCAFFWPVDAKETMPIRTTKYVELSCEQDVIGLLVPLSFNLLILSVCCIFAFLTRALPDNFNESWFILLSVSGTLFVWAAFLPTYFSAFYASHKVALLGLALILNGFITVVCFFATKLYALAYVAEKDIKVTDFDTQSFYADSQQSRQ